MRITALGDAGRLARAMGCRRVVWNDRLARGRTKGCTWRCTCCPSLAPYASFLLSPGQAFARAEHPLQWQARSDPIHPIAMFKLIQLWRRVQSTKSILPVSAWCPLSARLPLPLTCARFLSPARPHKLCQCPVW